MKIKVDNYASFDEFSASGTAGNWNTITVIREDGWIKSDLMTECKSYKTALRRFFDNLKDVPEVAEWRDCITESCECGYFKENEPQSYAWAVEEINEGEWYIYLNTRTEQTDNEPNGTTDKEVDEMAQNILFMEKRGCDFFHGEHINSDIGNYRICTASYIKLADGRQMFFEFCRSDRYQFRNVNKRTGAPLKKPVRELVMKDACALNTCYDGGDGMSYRDLNMEHSFHSSPMPYTLKTVLEFINSVSAEHYDTIQFV